MATVTLPPGPTTPRAVQALYALTASRRGIPRLRERYGDAFTIHHPIFRRCVVISDPAEIRQLFQSGPELVDNIEPNLGRVLGPGSLFAQRGEAHRRQRKLLVPPFHGRRLDAYRTIVEEETLRETATWPQDRPFPTMPSMMRITLGVILRAVFGVEGAESAELRDLLPRMVTLGSRLALLPIPRIEHGWWSPWARFLAMRRRYDGIVERLVNRATADGDLDAREDILAMMLGSRYEDGSPMSQVEIADQLLTLLSAGHETTATTLAWAVERLRRHPDVLAALVEEVDAGGGALREATILEVQRTRPVIDMVARQVTADTFQLGRWTLPRGCAVLVSIALVHDDEAVFRQARRFDPYRFVDAKPDWSQWIPFGGGTRRCLGAAFAQMEMDVVLRTLLREFTLLPTSRPPERWHSRGVAFAPGNGGVAVVRRRHIGPGPARDKDATPVANAVTVKGGTDATATA
jgi:cytochrome P450